MKRAQMQWIGLLGLAAAVAMPGPARAEAPSGREIVEKAWWSVKLDGAEMVSTMIIRNARGQRRVRKIASISKLYDGGKTEKRLIRFLAPADVKGTGLLTYDYEKKDDDIWFFLPALRKTRRIVSSQKAKNFMGSEFTYADITPGSVDDFKYKRLRSDRADGTDCWVVQSTPRTKEIARDNGYSRRVAWFGKKDHVVRKALIYDLRGRLLKTLTATRVKEIDPAKKRYRSLKMTMVNAQNKRSSVLDVAQIKLRKQIPDKYFTTRYLERF